MLFRSIRVCCAATNLGAGGAPPIKFLYNKHDYAKVVEGGYFYRDTSRYISMIAENEEDHQLFLRPPRFGKSFSVSMLGYYLDILHEGRFDALFGKTEIGAQKKTLKHNNNYHVMKFDFTVNIGTTGDLSTVEKNFDKKIERCVQRFASRYGIDLPQYSAMEMVVEACERILAKNGKVFSRRRVRPVCQQADV